MGAYQYCPKCGSGMDAPTLAQAHVGEQRCHNCGAMTKPPRNSMEWALERNDERIAELERQVQTLTKIVTRLARAQAEKTSSDAADALLARLPPGT